MKPGFKQTEAGVIPEDWIVAPIGELANVTTGSKNTQDAVADGQYPFFVRSQTVERINTFSFEGEAVLTAGDGVGTGKVFHYINGKIDVHQRVYRISNFDRRLNGYYFFRYFSLNFYNRIMQMTAKSSVDSVRRPMITGMLIPLPPTLAEQEAIAEALGDADALIESLERLVAKKRDVKQGAMQELLTARRRLPGFTGKWEQVEFGSVATIRNEKAFASSMPAETPCVELEAIGSGTGRLITLPQASGSSSKYRFMKGDVLFGRLRAYLKKYWSASFCGVCSTEIWPLIPRSERLRSEYLHLIVQTSGFANAAGVSYGTHMPRSDWSILRKYGIQLPQVEEQSAIASVLSDMDAEIAALEENLEKARAIKQGMMQELLTGRIRLV